MLLAIETAYAACSAALIGPEGVVAARHELIGRGHAERLVPLIGELLAEASALPTAIVVDVGPGSFTGLRVGIATARALALAWDVPVSGYSAMPLVAAAAFAGDAACAEITVAMDAGRGEVFVQRFARDLGSAAPAAVMTPAMAARMAAGTIAGTGAPALHDAGVAARLLSSGPPDAADVRLLDPGFLGLRLTPLYVREPDAKLPVA